MVHLLTLTPTSCLVRSFAHSLPRRYLTIYLDNYFISIPLFSELRAYNFGAVSTTRLYTGFPKGLAQLKQFATKLEWNTLLEAVVQDCEGGRRWHEAFFGPTLRRCRAAFFVQPVSSHLAGYVLNVRKPENQSLPSFRFQVRITDYDINVS